MVPMDSLPGFWKFMYRVSPLTYLVDGLISTGLAHNDVKCSQIEFLHFAAPQNMTCGEYMEPFMELAGGRLLDPGSTDACQFCTLATTDAFLASTSTSYDKRWRNYGIMWAYIVFNLFAALALYWLIRVPKRFKPQNVLRGVWKGRQ